MTTESTPKKTAASRPWLIAAIIFVLGFDLAFLWQQRDAAAASEFGGHPEEGANYVTGLAFQNYLAHDLGHPPAPSLAAFAAHYPIARTSIWPPVFPGVQAAWSSLFGKSRRSMLILLCAVAGLLSLVLHLALRREFGVAVSAAAVVLFLSLPLVREHDSMLMPELLCATCMLSAALALSRFAEHGRLMDSLGFGCFAALAMLTDRAGFALAFFIPLFLILAGKKALFLRPQLWAGLAFVVPFAWHFSFHPSLDFTRVALPFYTIGLANTLGIVLLVVIVPAIVVTLTRPASRTPLFVAATALLTATLLFIILAPADLDQRRLLPAFPALALFAAAGSAAIARRIRRPAGAVLLVIALLSITLHETLAVKWRGKKWSGFRPLAELVLTDYARPSAHVLISSDAIGEGMFISEIAMAENPPSHFIESAGSFLAKATFGDDDELARLLTSAHIDYIVFDASNPDLDHSPSLDMLRRVLRDHSDRFWEMSASPIVRDGFPPDGSAHLYRVNAQ